MSKLIKFVFTRVVFNSPHTQGGGTRAFDETRANYLATTLFSNNTNERGLTNDLHRHRVSVGNKIMC